MKMLLSSIRIDGGTQPRVEISDEVVCDYVAALQDGAKFPPKISLLGLTMAVEMGADSSITRSLIDTTLDEVEQVLT